MKQKLKRIFKRTVPLILVCSLTIGAVLGHNTKEVKAVAGVDDALIVVALLAMCGVAYTGINYAWHGGQGWVNEGDTEFPYGDVKEWGDGFNDKWQKQWDEEVKKEAKEKGLIDENDNIVGGGSPGGGSDGGDNNDNKFPSWDKIKNLAKEQRNIGIALSSYLPFIAILGYQAYKESIGNSKLTYADIFQRADVDVKNYFIKNGLNLSDCRYIVKFVDSRFVSSETSTYGKSGATLLVYCMNNGYCTKNDKDTYSFNSDNSVIQLRMDVYDDSLISSKINSTLYPNGTGTAFSKTKSYTSNLPFKDSTGKISPVIISPDTITPTSPLLDFINNNKVVPDSVINDFARFPTNEEFSKYLKDLKDNNDDEEKKKVLIDDFIKKLTTETGTPDPAPNPNPDPGGGETPDPNPNPNPGGGETPSPNPNPDDTSNESFTRDLKLIFPFCIPFDLVDCFKLFNAEPETPRIEVPMHFGIIDVDYTWVIDLKDFDSVAVICRSMFLILFLIGLALATSKVIKW